VRDVYSARNPTQVGFYKQVLDDAGIPSFIRNENPPDPGVPIFDPTLCVINDGDYEQAIALIKARHEEESQPRADWKCPSCSEINPGNFEICWQCQTARPGG
jgi:hypothetical protein